MKRYTYRFKTEEEFIRYLGNGWRNRIRQGWDYDMDNFIGEKLEIFDEKQLQRLRNGNSIEYLHSKCHSHWSICKEMMVIKNITPNYKPKRIKRFL
jgi:hypothetical protein